MSSPIKKERSILEKTEVSYGIENTIKMATQSFSNVKYKADVCSDSKGPAIFVEAEPVWKAYNDMKNRKVKIRFITEITKDNIFYCKKLSEIGEVKHLEELNGNFGVLDETDYYAPTISQEYAPTVPMMIHISIKDFVNQHQYFFNILWNKAIPSELKIKEIEEGIELIKTKVLENRDEIYNHFVISLKRSNELNACSSIDQMQIVYNNFFNLYQEIIERQKRQGEGNGIKWLTYIDNDKKGIEIVKTFLNTGIQVRHIKNLPVMNFSFDRKNIQATIEKMDNGGIMNSLLISNDPEYVNHFKSYFQELWDNYGVDAAERIKDIEEGMEYDIEVIRHSDRTWKLYLDIVRSAQSEIFFILPTPMAFVRQIKAIESSYQVSKERKVKVRILTPKNEIVEDLIYHLPKESKVAPKDSKKNTVSCFTNTNIEIRYIEKMSTTKSSILVVDRKESLIMELKDDAKDTFTQAIGLSIYSSSKTSVLSYVAIFENLWKQAELYQEIKESNEKLEVKDRVLNEFIHIAAHELRNPIQPILGLSEVIKSIVEQKKVSEIDTDKIYSLLDTIIRNAKKLLRLTDDVLDIAKIETKTLALNRETFNLIALLQVLIDDFKSQQQKDICKIKLHIILKEKQAQQQENIFLIKADKSRISQVISNLLLNALKFTDKDYLIQVIIEKKEIDNKRKKIIVSIKDTGTGIDSEIYPKLFTKFATKSSQGTGLGLFICKNIVEAHGGKIWAENNKDGQGATFSFSLPLDV